MPGFDRTGPSGIGPMTGGGRGRCAPRGTFRDRLFRGTGFGQGRGFGMGHGSGRCTWVPAYYDAPYSSVSAKSRDQEIDILKNEAQALKEELKDIESRISELEKQEN